MTRHLALIAALSAGACVSPADAPTDSLASRFDGDTSAVSTRHEDGRIDTILYNARDGELADASWHADDFVWEWTVDGFGYGAHPLASELSMEQGNADLHAMWLSFAARRDGTPYLLLGDPWEACRAFPGMCLCFAPPCPWELE